jgi:hypothetical protein
MAQRISQYVALESTVALVMIAFGTLLLTNEHVTTELRHLAEMDSLTNVSIARLPHAAGQGHQQRPAHAPGAARAGAGPRPLQEINDTWGHGGGTMCYASLWPWPSSACARKT